MTIFFISDLHLDQNHPDSYKLLTNFFDNLPKDTEAIYILGDLFEYWIGDRLDNNLDNNLNNNFLTNIKNILNQPSRQFPIYFIHGNRDFLIGANFAKQTNITILPEFYKIQINNQNILLTHGDALMPDLLHFYFSKIIRSSILKFIANILPIKIKLFIAEKLRILSAARFKLNANKNSKIYDVSQDLIEKYLHKYSCNILIHGHTHKPNIHNFTVNNANFTRIVLSDWHSTAQILVFDQNGYKLKTI